MITHFHGVDKHSTHLTVTTVNQKGEIVNRIARCKDFSKFIDTLSANDAVAIETGNMTFHLADEMEAKNATVFIVDARANKIISSSVKKTDKNDSEKLALCLRAYLNGDGYTAFPTVYKPSIQIRRLRRMFSGRETINKSIVQLKNTIIGMIRDTGLRLSGEQYKKLFYPSHGKNVLEEINFFLLTYA